MFSLFAWYTRIINAATINIINTINVNRQMSTKGFHTSHVVQRLWIELIWYMYCWVGCRPILSAVMPRLAAYISGSRLALCCPSWSHKSNKTGISDTFVVNGAPIYDKNLISVRTLRILAKHKQTIPKSDKLCNTYLGNKPNLSSLYSTPTGPNNIIIILKVCKAKQYRWWRYQHVPPKTVMWAM